MNDVVNIDDELDLEPIDPNCIPLGTFIEEFGDSLLDAVRQHTPPIYDGTPNPAWDAALNALKRKPFDAQRHAVTAICKLLLEHDAPAGFLNAEMGTGKTMMAICASVIHHLAGAKRFMILSPPHLVYKWRREIMDTVPNATVWVLNGPDTLAKLLKLKNALDVEPDGPEYFILGRVRMRMGFHWKPAYTIRHFYKREHIASNDENSPTQVRKRSCVACSSCGDCVRDSEGERVTPAEFTSERRTKCGSCGEALWTLMRPSLKTKTMRDRVVDGICQLPTLGPRTAERLVDGFGEEFLAAMLADNVYEFINLMDDEGDLVFSDRQAKRMERALANLEFSFGQGGYQPTEFIKRYLPANLFDMLIVDEGHEYKNASSAQGAAMGVLASQINKVLVLTGTLMGGYADDLFYLLWRIMPRIMMEDGYLYNERRSLGSACMSFMRDHGVLKDVYKETESKAHKTARGNKLAVRTSKAPGFGPKGIARFVLPYTVFLKLADIGQNVLPPYREHFIDIAMTPEQDDQYSAMQSTLNDKLRKALAMGDTTLMGVVVNALLAWPDCCFKPETVKHPRTRDVLHYAPAVVGDDEPTPKEAKLIELCLAEKRRGRRVLVYSVYTGKRDTASRIKSLLTTHGLKVAVLRSSVDTSKREDWIMDQVDRGIDVLVSNPELVKTGLDLLEFATIVFMQTGYNVYTAMQAARRSWRIGQKEDVDVYFFGFLRSAQIACLQLMAKKIAVSQSTSGDMPGSGLDILNSQEDDSIEIALAKQLMTA